MKYQWFNSACSLITDLVRVGLTMFVYIIRLCSGVNFTLDRTGSGRPSINMPIAESDFVYRIRMSILRTVKFVTLVVF
jgi:hypothetical protein